MCDTWENSLSEGDTLLLFVFRQCGPFVGGEERKGEERGEGGGRGKIGWGGRVGGGRG